MKKGIIAVVIVILFAFVAILVKMDDSPRPTDQQILSGINNYSATDSLVTQPDGSALWEKSDGDQVIISPKQFRAMNESYDRDEATRRVAKSKLASSKKAVSR